MEIVIKIPKETYEALVINQYCGNKSNLENIITEGTPLPQHHGDLVDFDRLCEEYWDGNYMEIHKDDLLNIKPTIEADKEGEE